MTVPPLASAGDRAASPAAGRRSSAAGIRTALGGLGYVIPTWVFMIAVGLIPIGYAVSMSLTDQSLTGTGGFVGLENYLRAVFTPRFLGSLGITMLFVVAGLVIQFVLGYLLALALHRQLKGFRIARTVLLIPMLLTPVVVGLTWQFMFNPDLGIITAMLGWIGIDVDFFAHPALARGVIILIDAWMFTPFVMLMLVAGMTGVPDEPLEAASLDGASWWQTTRYVVLPMLLPVITVALIVRCIDTVRLFDVIYTSTQGGPGTATETVSIISYVTTFEFYQFGEGAAMSVALAVIMFPVYFLYIRLTKV